MEPSLNFYQSSEQPIATPAVRSSPKEDFYLTLMAFDREQGSHATFRAIVNPAVPWLWVGGLIVGLGAVLAIWPRGDRRRTRSASLPHRRTEGDPGGERTGEEEGDEEAEEERHAVHV
jgi:cytochrome c-type biogenesis protein CcmF